MKARGNRERGTGFLPAGFGSSGSAFCVGVGVGDAMVFTGFLLRAFFGFMSTGGGLGASSVLKNFSRFFGMPPEIIEKLINCNTLKVNT